MPVFVPVMQLQDLLSPNKVIKINRKFKIQFLYKNQLNYEVFTEII
jgi:hypothetical protein